MELTKQDIKENLILAEKGEELTFPLAILNENKYFKTTWNEKQKQLKAKEYREKARQNQRRYYKNAKAKKQNFINK